MLYFVLAHHHQQHYWFESISFQFYKKSISFHSILLYTHPQLFTSFSTYSNHYNLYDLVLRKQCLREKEKKRNGILKKRNGILRL